MMKKPRIRRGLIITEDVYLLYTESGFTIDFTDSVVKDFVLWDVSEAHQSGFSLPA